MILYSLPFSTYSAKIQMQLDLKGLSYILKEPPGGYGTPEWKKLVPLGTIPGLVDGDLCIGESDVIANYIEDAYPEPPLLSADPVQRARQRFLCRYHDMWLEPHIRGVFPHINEQTRDMGVVDASLDQFQAYLDMLERLFDPDPFMCGKEISLPDLAFPGAFIMADLLMPLFGRAPSYGEKVSVWRAAVNADPVIGRISETVRSANVAWLQSIS